MATISGGPIDDLLQAQPDGSKLQGKKGNDTLRGGKGDDTLQGGIGDDKLLGGRGDDYLVGGRGNDTLVGGEGNDTLQGGEGSDTLRGGAGNDTFRVTLKDFLSNGGGVDTIQDFVIGEDTLQFSGQAQVSIVGQSDDVYSFDLTGNGEVDYIVKLTGVTNFTLPGSPSYTNGVGLE